MQEVAEDPIAVVGVLGRVEDVGVPHLVELLGRHDGPLGVHHTQLQKAAVLDDAFVGLLDRHPHPPRFGVDELERDRLEIELIDQAKPLLDIACVCGHGVKPSVVGIPQIEALLIV